MTYLEAAHTILTQTGQPLHYADITQRALDQGLIDPTGLTPDATMGSRLYTDTKQDGSQFVRAGRGIFDLAKRRPGGIDRQVNEINDQTRSQLRDLLHIMPPARFEALIMELLLQMGFDESTVQVTPFGGDGGIDVTGVYRAAGLTEVYAAVQAKRWKSNVQAPTVTQMRGSLQVHQQGIIITTSDYSKGARKEAAAANKTHIGLINGGQLIDLLIKHRVGVGEKTLTVVLVDDEWWGELLETSEAPEPVAEPKVAQGKPAQPLVSGGPTGRKPASVTLLGESHAVTSWKALLVTVCAVLAAHHPDGFADVATQIKGRKRQFISPTGDGMISPAPIPGTDLYVETNLSAKDVMKLCDLLITQFGYHANMLAITYQDAALPTL